MTNPHQTNQLNPNDQDHDPAEQSYRLGMQRERDFQFNPTYLTGHCWPQAHWCVTETSSAQETKVSRCLRCGFTIIHNP